MNIKNSLFVFIWCFLNFSFFPQAINVAVTDLPDTFNPVLSQNIQGLYADELLFDGLFNREVDEDYGDSHSVYSLACDIAEYGTDKKTFLITLESFVEWHDSTAENPHYFSADDVIYSFDAYCCVENNSPKRELFLSKIESYEAIDKDHIIIRFKKPIPDFRAVEVLSEFKIIPCNYKGKKLNVNLRSGDLENLFSKFPVGTGPFMLKSSIDRSSIVFENNYDYLNRPEVKSIVFFKISDPDDQIEEMKAGFINIIPQADSFMRKKIPLTVESTIKRSSFMPYSIYNIQINTRKFPDNEGRKSIAMAINKSSIIPGITDNDDSVFKSSGIFPENYLTHLFPEYFDDIINPKLPFKPAEAKDMAVKHGIAGNKVTLKYPVIMGMTGKTIADSISVQLKDIGLDVEVVKESEDSFQKDLINKNYELALMYTIGFDKWNFLMTEMYKSGGSENVSGINSIKLDECIDKFNMCSHVIELNDALNKLESQFVEDCPAVHLFTLPIDVYYSGIENIVTASENPFISAEFWKLESDVN